MRRPKIIKFTVAAICILVALTFISIAFLPFQSFKSSADLLSRDGNFKSLNTNNAFVFRILLAGLGLCCAGVGIIIAAGFSSKVIGGIRQYVLDLRAFIQSLKPKKTEWFPFLILLLVLACAFIIRLHHMNDEISHDEAYTYVVFSSTSLFFILLPISICPIITF